MVKTINGWVQSRNCFVKELEENIFQVVRAEKGDDLLHYETYSKVDLNDVTEKTFSTFLDGLGNYHDFLAEETKEKKAAYLAFHAYNYDIGYSCANEKEFSEFLEEYGVILKGEVFNF